MDLISLVRESFPGRNLILDSSLNIVEFLFDCSQKSNRLPVRVIVVQIQDSKGPVGNTNGLVSNSYLH